MTWIAIPLSLFAVGATFAGGFAALRLRSRLEALLALSGGVVVAVALFDVLPEAIDAVGDARRVGSLIGAGFLGFFLIQRLLVLHHRDEPDEAKAHSRVGALGAAGLSAHSFLDGLAIGLAFGLDTSTGLLVFMAVVAHDFADGLNTVSFVLRQGDDRLRARRWLMVDALAPLLGAIVGTLVNMSEYALGNLLAVYAGVFLFMGASDLLPEAHAHPSWRRVVLTVVGFCGTWAIAWAATQ
jgi:ZIP family zinc transporter